MTAKQKRRQRRVEDRQTEQQPEPETVEITSTVPKVQYIVNPCPVCQMAGLRRVWNGYEWKMICYRCKHME